MDRITVDFSKECGKIKPMHSTNNGPAYKFGSDQRITNLHHFQRAGIPYCRTHDASICSTYGGEHTVDVNNIFPDFDADPTDPASYDFQLTDEYMKVIELGGGHAFYRLGSRIEHWSKKYNTLPPKDFKKWAVICEHIIRHYTEGWANGLHLNIEYWEIWNEPDLDADDSTHKRCWGGTAAEFYKLFRIALEHLKGCFPHLKIGGPACARVDPEWWNGLFNALGDVKPDFFSWHAYKDNVEKVQSKIREARKLLDDAGLTECESILNEWNYVKGWHDDVWIYSLKTEQNLKGAAFIASTMCMSQYEQLDNLMYYDARPGTNMNGMFDHFICDTRKGYWPFVMFNDLYKQDSAVPVERESADVWAAAAKGDEQNVMLSYFNDDDNAPAKDVKIEFKKVNNTNGVKLEYYCLDENHDMEIVREEIFTATEFSAYLKMPLYSTWLLKIVNL